jgi:hypothetical protein
MRLTVNKKDTQKAFSHLDRLLLAVSQNAYVATQKAANDYSNLAKSGMAVTTKPGFAPTWEPLSEYWKAVKTGHKKEFWAETLGIYKATQVTIIQKTLLFINIFAGIRDSTDYDAFIRAARNEYGFGLGPARPLFEPAKDHLAPVTATGRRLNAKQRQYFIIALNQAVRKVALNQAVRKVYGYK